MPRNQSAPTPRSVTVFSRSSQVHTSPVNVSAGGEAGACAVGVVWEAQPASESRASEPRASQPLVFMRREVLQTRCQRTRSIFRMYARTRMDEFSRFVDVDGAS